ncbi:MAG: hypothetical protein LBP26_06930 [Clostridiales bacterium]|nr:hypothetical protein [Clostridiales bacterium]
MRRTNNHPGGVRRHEPSRQTAEPFAGRASLRAKPVNEARHSIEGNLGELPNAANKQPPRRRSPPRTEPSNGEAVCRACELAS